MKAPMRIVALTMALAVAQTSVLAPADAGEIVVIGHVNVPKIDLATVQKIYTGKFIAVAGVHVSPVSVKPGSVTRNRFLQDYLNQDEEKFTAYWTVRRYIGKGVPPAELGSSSEVIHHVQSTPGAVGFIDETELKPGLNIIARR